MGTHLTRLMLASSAVWFAIGSTCRADLSLIPQGLSPGDQYRLMFVTSTTTQGTSSDVSYYDSFVSAAATAAGLNFIDGQSVTWQAIVSTPTVDANDSSRLSASSNAPIYRVDGVEIASNGANLWQASGYLLAALDVNEFGNYQSSYVWTGTNFNGFGSPDYQLGTAQSFPVDAEIGISTTTDGQWTQYEPTFQKDAFSVYAVSSILIVAAPEPSTLIVVAIAIPMGLGYWWLRRGRSALLN